MFAPSYSIAFDDAEFRSLRKAKITGSMKWSDVRAIHAWARDGIPTEVVFLRFADRKSKLVVNDLYDGFKEFMAEVDARFGLDPSWYMAATLNLDTEILLYDEGRAVDLDEFAA
ncbi:MAG: hypothetical protein H6923_04305 [Alphaproteobacteria bacterium]|nr:hypothetical protein [Alphaproteobacteria bacterium]